MLAVNGCLSRYMFPPLYIASTARILDAHNSHVPVALCLACMTRMDTVRLCVPNRVVNCLASCSWNGKKVFHLPELKSCTRTLGVRRHVTCRHKKNTSEKKTENLESFQLIVLEAPVLLNRL
jgi:hypothetical protein